MDKISLLCILIFSLLFASCSTEESADVNQDRVQMSLKLEYNANDQKTNCSATFRFGEGFGTLLELTPPASVRFNDQEMYFDEDLLMSSYKWTFNTKVETGTFEYIDVDGKVFINTVSLPAAISPKADFNTLSKSKMNEIPFIGDPLLADEELEIIIDYSTQSESGTTLFIFGPGESPILSPADLESIPLGNATLSLTRSRSRDLDQGTSAGGGIEENYHFESTIEILE